MKKILLTTAIGLVILIAVSYALLLRYVNTPVFRSAIEEAASQAVNARVSIPSLGLSLPLVVTANHISVSDFDGHQKGSLEKLLLDVAPLSLFSNNIRVNRLTLVSPHITWRLTDPLPSPAFQPTPPESNNTTNAAPTNATSRVQQNPAAEQPKPNLQPQSPSAQPATSKSIQLTVDNIRIQNAVVEIKDPEDKTLVHLSGLGLTAKLTASPEGDVSGRGTLTLATAKLPDNLTFTQATSPLLFSSKEITLPDISAKFYDGKITGDFRANLASEAFSLNLTLLSASLYQLTAATGQPREELRSARLNTVLQTRGTFHNPQSLTGSGEFSAGPLSLGDIPAAETLAALLGATGMIDPQRITTIHIERLLGEIQIRDQNIHLENVRTEPSEGPMALNARGTVGFDSALNIRASLGLQPDHFGLPPATVTALGGTDPANRVLIPFSVSGTTDEPRVELNLDIIAANIGADLLQQAAGVVEKITAPETLENIQRQGERLLRGLENIFAPAPRRGNQPTPVPPADSH